MCTYIIIKYILIGIPINGREENESSWRGKLYTTALDYTSIYTS